MGGILGRPQSPLRMGLELEEPSESDLGSAHLAGEGTELWMRRWEPGHTTPALVQTEVAT